MDLNLYVLDNDTLLLHSESNVQALPVSHDDHSSSLVVAAPAAVPGDDAGYHRDPVVLEVQVHRPCGQLLLRGGVCGGEADASPSLAGGNHRHDAGSVPVVHHGDICKVALVGLNLTVRGIHGEFNLVALVGGSLELRLVDGEFLVPGINDLQGRLASVAGDAAEGGVSLLDTGNRDDALSFIITHVLEGYECIVTLYPLQTSRSRAYGVGHFHGFCGLYTHRSCSKTECF